MTIRKTVIWCKLLVNEAAINDGKEKNLGPTAKRKIYLSAVRYLLNHLFYKTTV